MAIDPQSTNQSGPESALEALKAFKEAQDRRVAHWKEYDEALAHYERTNLYADEHKDEGAVTDTDTATEASGHGHRCGPPIVQASGHGNGASASNAHYHTVALPMTDAIFSKVLALVTSGLLDCSHSVRAIETELRTTFQRSDLASLVGGVQEKENAVLRAIVQRDQDKRIAKVEGRDLADEILRLDNDIVALRGQIQETMSEINAEMAEM